MENSQVAIVASVFILSLILATTVKFFAFSHSFTNPASSIAGHHNQVVGRLAKFI